MTPPPATAVPTLGGLAAEVAALRRRVALLESRTGSATDETLSDLDEQEAIAMLGGDAARLAEIRADAAKRRAK